MSGPNPGVVDHHGAAINLVGTARHRVVQHIGDKQGRFIAFIKCSHAPRAVDQVTGESLTDVALIIQYDQAPGLGGSRRAIGGWQTDDDQPRADRQCRRHTCDALEGFDTEDVLGPVVDVREEVAKLPQRHAAVWDVFKTVANKKDTEALERFLEPEDLRGQFYEALTAYAGTLQVALATVDFYIDFSEDRIKTYKETSMYNFIYSR